MIQSNNLDYLFHIIAPFNTKMVLDHLNLIGKYEKLRKLLYSKLNEIYPNQIVIEKFSKDENPRESIKNWLSSDETTNQEDDDIRLFKRTGESGVTQKDKSIITIKINEKYNMLLDDKGKAIFSTPPTILLETMSYHEYGVGMIYCKLDLKFKKEFLTINEIEPREIINYILDKTVTCPKLLSHTESIGKKVHESYLKVAENLSIKKPVISYEDLFSSQKSSVPLWGHIVLVKKCSEEIKTQIMSEVIAISHPEGPINFTKGTEGFVHIGWGNSLWANLSESELDFAKEILRYCEIEWRTLQVFNEILYRRMNQFASYQKLHKKFVKEAIDWINILKMEMELYSVNKSNYIQNLAPFAHFVYNEVIISWRISQMSEFYDDKLEVFEYLHQQGRDKLNELSDSRINNILFIFTCLSLVSTFIDGLMFVFAENVAEFIAFRLFLLIFPPVAFIILILLIFTRLGKRGRN